MSKPKQKLHPKMRAALHSFLRVALDQALDGVEEKAQGQPSTEFSFDAENELVRARVKVATALMWTESEEAP